MTKKVNIIKKATLSILAVLLAAISFAVIGETVLADAACSHSPATRTTAATCTASGKRQTYCRICGKVLSTSYTSALGHSYSSATCTSARRCTRCGATSGSALGHSYSSATCTSARRCTRCGATSGSALGHSYSSATCTSAKKCTRCGVTSGSALGHNYLITRSATCGAAGIKTCSRCSATQTIAATGNHSPATRISKAATCEVTGTRQTYCIQCSKVLSASTIAALGHNYQTTKSATCGATGIKTCSRCSATQTIAATGNHSPATRIFKAATCETTGTRQTYCTTCNNTLSTATIAALGHNYQTTKAATCGATGIKTCSRCSDQKTIAATGQHTPDTENPKVTPATCLNNGKKETYCKNCDTLMGTVTIEATGHNYTRTYCTEDMKCTKCGAVATGSKEFCHALVVVTDATCTADGLKKCINSGCPYTEIIKGGHVRVAATCSAPERCTRCNATWGNGLGHVMTGGSCTEAAHCTREGCTYKAPLIEGHNYTRTYCTEDMKCAKCGAVATGSKEFCHNLVVVTDATCTADGLKKCVSPDCQYTEPIKGGHVKVAATCSAPERCTRCNATWGNGLGHDMTVGSCTEASVCRREGCKYRDVLGSHTPQFGEWQSYASLYGGSVAACKARVITCNDCKGIIRVETKAHNYCTNGESKKCIECNYEAMEISQHILASKNDSAIQYTIEDDGNISIQILVCYGNLGEDSDRIKREIKNGIRKWAGPVNYGGTQYNISVDIREVKTDVNTQKNAKGFVQCDGVLYFDMTDDMNKEIQEKGSDQARAHYASSLLWGSQTGFYIELGDKASYYTDGTLSTVIAHEVGHAMGIADAYEAIDLSIKYHRDEQVFGVDNNDLMFGLTDGYGRSIDDLKITNLDRCMILEAATENRWTTFGHYDSGGNYNDEEMSQFVIKDPNKHPELY